MAQLTQNIFVLGLLGDAVSRPIMDARSVVRAGCYGAIVIGLCMPLLALDGTRHADAEEALKGENDSGARRTIRQFFLYVDSLNSSTFDTSELKRFYAERDFRPVWTGSSGALMRRAEVQEVLGHADREGLDSAAYAIASPQSDGEEPGAGHSIGDDIAITDRVLQYMRDVRTGRVAPKNVYADVDLPAPTFDAVRALQSALTAGSLSQRLSQLAPSHPEYQRLVHALAIYRGIANRGGWKPVHASGDKEALQRVLAARLALEDPHFEQIDKPSSAQITEALKQYQSRNGLAANGELTSETIAALNVPVLFRIQQITANLERWRWMPETLERQYVAVNVPDQILVYIDDGRPRLESRVIVGRKTSPTPIVRTAVVAVVTNPPWDIPGDIAARDLLPRLKKDRAYLQSHKMIVRDGPDGDPAGLTINWASVSADAFPYAIQQLPGRNTALGTLMLDSPNDFDVYLHDTPGKVRFRQDVREISNGCVRVENILQLASLALTNDASSGLRTVQEGIASGQTWRLALTRPLPVYMVYWTAVANDNGTVGFRPDRYNRDPPLISALVRRS